MVVRVRLSEQKENGRKNNNRDNVSCVRKGKLERPQLLLLKLEVEI